MIKLITLLAIPFAFELLLLFAFDVSMFKAIANVIMTVVTLFA